MNNTYHKSETPMDNFRLHLMLSSGKLQFPVSYRLSFHKTKNLTFNCRDVIFHIHNFLGTSYELIDVFKKKNEILR